MKIHLLAALSLVLFFTADIFAQSFPPPTQQTTSYPYYYWTTSAPSFSGDELYYAGSTASQVTVGEEEDYWVHFAEEDTATEQIYRRFTQESEPISETPHVIAIYSREGNTYRGKEAYDNNSGLDGSWELDQDNNLVVTIGPKTYVFRTDRIGENILILVKE